MRIARENDPLSAVSNSALTSVLILQKNYPEALKYSEKAVELQPNAPLVKIQLASVYFLNGRSEEAIELLKIESQKPRHKYDSLAGLAYIYAKTGKLKEATEIFYQLRAEKDISNQYSDLALIAFTLGKKEEALGHFKAVMGKSKMMPISIVSDPYWEEVFKDKDFKALADQAQNKDS